MLSSVAWFIMLTFGSVFAGEGTCPAGDARCKRMASMEIQGVSYLMVGNPGVGKSCILNGLCGKTLFKSGFNFVESLTKVLQIEQVNGNWFMDTPGLADIKLREKAAQEIEAALKTGGQFKIFFVMTLEEGHVRPADKVTMQLVLQAAPIRSYGVIINKIEDAVHNALMASDENKQKVMASLMDGLTQKSVHFHFQKRMEDLAGQMDMALPLSTDLVHFVMMLPSVQIRKEDVKQIETDVEKFEEMEEKYDILIQQLITQDEVRQKHLEDNKEEYQELIKKLEEREKEMQGQLEDMRRMAAEKQGEGGGGILGEISQLPQDVAPPVGPLFGAGL